MENVVDLMNKLDYQSKRVHLEWILPNKTEGLPEWYYKAICYNTDFNMVYSETSNMTVEMITWCENNCKDTWGTFGFSLGRTFFFINEEDCLMFKLVF